LKKSIALVGMVKYFSSLNYTLANEDSSLEYELVRYFQSQNILSVCGSGSRALPLLHTKAQSLKVVDLVAGQLHLAQLRWHLIKEVRHEDYLKFFGYPPYRTQDHTTWRKELLLKSPVSSELLQEFESKNWQSLLYQGKWEQTFAFFSRLVKKVLGEHSERLFSFQDLKEQQAYLDSDFPWWRWNLLVRLIGNKAFFNALLYKGDFVKKNVPDSYYDYYQRAFRHLFTHDLARRSFFLQLCVLGQIHHAEGNLIEAQAACFQEMKESSAQVEFIQSDLISAIAQCQDLDFISLSDVPSYFQGEMERDFLQIIRPHLKIGGVAVLRSYLRVPQADRSGFKDVACDFGELLSAEKVQMYKIEILKRVS
jgi:S-adenosylmethionine-diacylglycerol 3-amino-3-carboxypropyl transferase